MLKKSILSIALLCSISFNSYSLKKNPNNLISTYIELDSKNKLEFIIGQTNEFIKFYENISEESKNDFTNLVKDYENYFLNSEFKNLYAKYMELYNKYNEYRGQPIKLIIRFASNDEIDFRLGGQLALASLFKQTLSEEDKKIFEKAQSEINALLYNPELSNKFNNFIIKENKRNLNPNPNIGLLITLD
jgi:hypothetical protein